MIIQTTDHSKYKHGVETCSDVAQVLQSAGWLSNQPVDGAAYRLSSLSAPGSVTLSLYDTCGLSIKVESGSRSRTWNLPSFNSGYHLLANPYGLFLAPVEPGETTHGLFASVPFIEEEIEVHEISSCVVLAEIGTAPRSILWLNDTELTDDSVAPGDTSWGVMQWQHFGVEGLLTTMGNSIRTPAALFLPYTGSGEPLGACPVRRAGYFRDCIVVSEYLASGQFVQQDDSACMVTLSQPGGETSTAGSVLWRIDEEL